MADTRLYELEECVSPQADDILLIEESATQTDKKVKVSSLMPTDAIAEAVDDWLDAHPEATTTVEDGSITPAKLHEDTLDLFDEKANTTGEYDDMTVGSAKQLLSKGYTENKAPYIYRKSAGGDRVYEELIGGTIAWNQISKELNNTNWSVSNGSVTYSDGICTLTPSAQYARINQYINYAENHKMLINVDIKLSNATNGSNVSASIYGVDTVAGGIIRTKCAENTNWQTISFICTSTTTSASNRLMVTDARTSDWGTIQIKNYQCIDLTQLFGTTIADYIYSLEQSTAGAGVAYFRQMFPSDYYAYDSGSLQSVNVASKKVVGFNQWDEVWENGTISADDELQNNGNQSYLRSKNYVPCVPNTAYYYFMGGTSGYVLQYDSNKNLLKRDGFANDGVFTTLSNARYIKFWTYKANNGFATYNHDICINISNASKNGTYEPYEEHTYALDSDVTLRGIPKLDASNNLYYDGDVYESDGTVTRKYGVVDLGSLTWTYGSSSAVFYSNALTLAKPVVNNSAKANIVSAKYVTTTAQSVFSTDNTIGIGNITATSQVVIKDTSAGTNAQTFKTAMSGVYLVYELATPTTESADAYTNPQMVDADGTEEFVDYAQSQGTRDMAVPVGHESKYMINLRAKIEDAVMLPTLPTANGTYTLKCTVASGVPTLSWVAD